MTEIPLYQDKAFFDGPRRRGSDRKKVEMRTTRSA